MNDAYQLQLQDDVEELPSQQVEAPGTNIRTPTAQEYMMSCCPLLRCSANEVVTIFIERRSPSICEDWGERRGAAMLLLLTRGSVTCQRAPRPESSVAVVGRPRGARFDRAFVRGRTVFWQAWEPMTTSARVLRASGGAWPMAARIASYRDRPGGWFVRRRIPWAPACKHDGHV